MPASLPPNSALLVIDMQEDFCEPNGSLAIRGGRAVAPIINSLLRLPFKTTIASRDHHPADHRSFASQHPGQQPFTSKHTIRNPEASGIDVEQQTIRLWPDHCVQETPGCELIPELDVSCIQHVVNKGEDCRVESYSAFGPPFRNPPVGMTILQKILEDEGIEKVYVCGLAYDYCVLSTAIDAVKAGFETFVVMGATEAVNQSLVDMMATTTKLEESGVKLTMAEEMGA